MAKWRCLHETITLSRRLGQCSLLAALLYTWGITRADAYGVFRRDDARVAILGRRRVSEAQVQAAVDELIACHLLCEQEHDGDRFLHWCRWDRYQAEHSRRRTAPPAFLIQCPNDNGGKYRGTAENIAARRQTTTTTTTTRKRKRKTTTTTTSGPPTPPEEPRSRLMEAVVARRPGAHAHYYDAYAALEEEYGADFMWECYQAALESNNTDPSARYLEGIARRCKVEGRMPRERQELRDEPEQVERPTEIGGRQVVQWVNDRPVFAAPAKAT